MLFNVVAAFIIPWIIAIYLIRKNVNILLLIWPVGSVLAFTVDILGVHLDFWHVFPFHDTEPFSALPMYLGLYPILACYMIYVYHTGRLNAFLSVIGFTSFITLMEYVALRVGYVVYGNGWAIYYTFLSYLVPLFLVYLYYRALLHLNILQSDR
jgi:hypothetical protein